MIIAGVDEVGRGPLAGPVVAAAVILPDNHTLIGLTDSKKLSAKKREILAEQIKAEAIAWCLGRAEAEEIDTLNIHHATLLAMQRAVQGLQIAPDKIMVDGKFCPKVDCEAEAVIKGDLKIEQISAASIIAKVARDKEMAAWQTAYPEYGFERHAGYPTKQHLKALVQHGVTPLHRRSYAPVKKHLLLAS